MHRISSPVPSSSSGRPCRRRLSDTLDHLLVVQYCAAIRECPAFLGECTCQAPKLPSFPAFKPGQDAWYSLSREITIDLGYLTVSLCSRLEGGGWCQTTVIRMHRRIELYMTWAVLRVHRIERWWVFNHRFTVRSWAEIIEMCGLDISVGDCKVNNPDLFICLIYPTFRSEYSRY